MDKKEKLRLMILDVLADAAEPVSSAKIADGLLARDVEVSERTVRLHLKEMDRIGLTKQFGRRGRMITESGREESEGARVLDRVGFLSGKIDAIAYEMTFDPVARSGTVVVNMSLIRRKDITAERLELVRQVFAKGFAMGRLMLVCGAGETHGGMTVPSGMIGFGTVCSITLNGVLQRYGIPVLSKFGGLLELKNGRARHFAELISYDGTSIDPLEIFIRSGMADYVGAVTTGNGRIGASFREFPAASGERIRAVAGQLESLGLGSLLCLGGPGQHLFGIPVGPQRIGGVVIGGLNPISIFEETGVRVQSRAMSGLVEYCRLFPYQEMETRLSALL